MFFNLGILFQNRRAQNLIRNAFSYPKCQQVNESLQNFIKQKYSCKMLKFLYLLIFISMSQSKDELSREEKDMLLECSQKYIFVNEDTLKILLNNHCKLRVSLLMLFL